MLIPAHSEGGDNLQPAHQSISYDTDMEPVGLHGYYHLCKLQPNVHGLIQDQLEREQSSRESHSFLSADGTLKTPEDQTGFMQKRVA